MKQIYTSLIALAMGLFGLQAMAQAPYCAAQFGSGCSFGDQIINFSTTGGLTNITNNGTTCSGGNYGDYTSMVVTVDYLGSFDISVQSGPTYSQDQTIWVDWNHDDDYDDAGEEVWSSATWTTATQTGTVTMPVGALAGSTTMRVRCNYNSQCVDPCAFQSYGEVEEYTVFVLPPVQNDAGIASIISPSLPTCDLDSVAVDIELQTLGTANLTSCDIKWQVNGGSVTTFAFTGNIAGQGGTAVVTLSASQNFTNGDVITIWTESPNGVTTDSLPNNDTLEIELSTGLAGLYQIPGDFADFNAATSALAAFGVCDSVIFNVATGSYNEYVEVGEYLGVSETATITFQGATGIAGDVSLEFDPSAAFSLDGVLNFDGADYITFKDMSIENLSNTFSYGRTIVMSGSSQNNVFTNCDIIGSPYNTTSFNNCVVYANGSELYNNEFTGNHVTNGSYLFYYYGDFNAHTSKVIIDDNVGEDFYYGAIYCYYNDSSTITGNNFYTNKPYTSIYGIYVYDNDQQLNIENNYVANDISTTGNMYYGLYVGNSDGSLNNRLRIANNCITGGNPNYTGFAYTFYINNSGLMDVHNNTITRIAAPTSTSGYTHYLAGGGLISELNNSFVTYGSQTARYVTSTYALSESDNNNYYSNGTNVLYLNGNYATVEDFATGTGFDDNSIGADPVFADTIACATCNDQLDGGGSNGSVVTEDIDGNIRSANTPDIGAVEYIAAGSFSLGPNDTICGNTYVMEAGPAQTVSWTVNSNVSSAATYTLTATNQPEVFNVSVNILTQTCGPASDNTLITLVPAASLDTADHICADATLTLDPGGAGNASYAWNTGDVTATLDVNASGNYTVTKDELGCTSTATIVVTQSDAVVIADAEPCSDDTPFSIDATINDGISYAWSGGSSNTTAINTFDASDIYSVTATDAFGCSSTSTFTLTVIESPLAAITYTTSGGTGVFFSSTASQQLSSNTTYNWTFDGSATSTLANPFYSFPFSPTAVTYPVTLEIDNGCGIDQVSMDVTLDPLSIDQVANKEVISAFPNPTTDVINIVKSESWKNAEFTLIDVTGRTVFSKSIVDANEMVTLDLSALSSGAYSLNIVQENGSQTISVIVD